MKVVLFLLIIRIIIEIRTPFFNNHATIERSPIGVRIFTVKSSRLVAVFLEIVNILFMLVGLEI